MKLIRNLPIRLRIIAEAHYRKCNNKNVVPDTAKVDNFFWLNTEQGFDFWYQINQNNIPKEWQEVIIEIY